VKQMTDVDELRHHLGRVMRALRHRRPPGFGRGRLGPRHAGALTAIAAGEGMTVGDLAERLGVGLTAASQIAGELSSAGLVRRSEDPADRRRTLVHLEDDRRAELQAWLDARSRPLQDALDRLSDDERAAFLRGLRLLADELESAAPRRHWH
jgi:DNA-binding MarR family transcriptional regulator